MIIDFVIFGICFISLYLSIFWISLFYVEGKDMLKTEKILNYPTVSILIPAYNEENVIARTIKSMQKIDYPKDKLEIIVINDGSTDRTVEIASKFGWIKLLNKEKGGKGSALNFGIKHAKGEIIGVVDADSIVTRDAVKLMIPLLNDPKTAAAISALKVHKPQNLLQKLQHFEYMLAAFIRRLMASLDTLYITPGVLSLYKKEIVTNLGGFATDTLTEDLEMGMKLRSNGYTIKSQIKAITRTTVPETLKALYKQRLRWRRGFFENIYKYKHMLFNRKYDLMGVFQLPVALLGPILAFVLIWMVSQELSKSWAHFMIAFDVLRWNVFKILPEIYSLRELVLSVKTITFFTIPIFLCTIFLLSGAHTHLKERWKYPLTWLVYFTVYLPFLTSFWFIASFYEVFGIKKKW